MIRKHECDESLDLSNEYSLEKDIVDGRELVFSGLCAFRDSYRLHSLNFDNKNAYIFLDVVNIL